MIDYDELDARIRRIVREELSIGKPRQVDSLERGNANKSYDDRFGNRWVYRWQLKWENLDESIIQSGSDTKAYGPFTEVKE